MERTFLQKRDETTRHAIENWAGRRPAPKDKRSTSLQENTETTRHARDDKPNADKDTDMEHTAY